jgi:hypothetical protein
MEKISTRRADLLPRTANLATLAVVVAAMWWSGAQRPAGQAMLAASDAVPAAPSSLVTTDAPAPRQLALPSATTTPATTALATWPAQAATTIARDGLQAVGYQTRTR